MSKLYEIASHMYILPPYRFTVYAIGIGLGYIMRTYKDFRFTMPQLNFGWLVMSLGILGTMFLSSYQSIYNYKFNITHAALFSAVAPIPWCLFFAWVIFTSQLRYRSEFGNVFIDLIAD